MRNKILLIWCNLILYSSSVYCQCSIQDYLLQTLNKEKISVEKLYSDSARTAFYIHTNVPTTLFDKQKVDNIDRYSFKLKEYLCVKSYQDNYCEINYRNNNLYYVRIDIYFNVKDSLLCKSTLKKITEESKVEVTFPLIHLGNSQNLLEKSNRKVIELKLDITTPFYIFYKNEKMQESVKIGYEFSNTSQEYDLSIEFLNLKNLN